MTKCTEGTKNVKIYKQALTRIQNLLSCFRNYDEGIKSLNLEENCDFVMKKDLYLFKKCLRDRLT